ncbi:hypothetical protein A6U86_27390 [Rhizobium sp. AC27/96]|uniref:hypothetical protein n=1 Tax=Rhizobium sp. AC27/96 TaxID=1841653 RepID=UPI0008290622|nr:hypothetical protein [Rhizobium sp. AC27/96]OCJ08641.1 hypothetical protein A6U86_27390 [Rhizobium sp. AC27/96]
MTTNQNVTFDDVLTFLLEEEVTPTHANLMHWIARYPSFANELTDYFAEWAVQSEMGDAETEQSRVERFANIGVSRALNLLHARQVKSASMTVKQPRTLAQLSGAVNMTFAALADVVGIDEEIITKLDLCRIPAKEIPRNLAESLAHFLNATIHEIWTSLSFAPRPTSARALQKSRKPAVIKTETFKEAIEASSMSPAQKDAWLRSINQGTGPP